MSTTPYSNSILSLNNLVQVKGMKVVIDSLTLEMSPGNVIALLGPNGAGKSSLLEMIAGLSKPHSGEIKFGPNRMESITPKQRAQRIGFLSQHSETAWPLEVQDFIGLGRTPYQGRFFSLHSKSDQSAIQKAMTQCGVEELSHRFVNTLSGGEFSRVLLARVLAGEPEWLLLDEPMTGLDPGHQFILCDLLRKLANEGIGIIVTLHDLSLAAHVADRVILLNQGKLISDGTVREVLTQGRIQEVYGVGCMMMESADGLALALSTIPLQVSTQTNQTSHPFNRDTY
jgi:iron complex transport system ATP-binding protein